MRLKAVSRRVGAVAAASVVAVVSGGVVGSADTEAVPAPAAACVSREQPLGFGLDGRITITVCPYDERWWEVVVGTKENGTAPLAGYTRVTGSDGSYYTGVWHSRQGFNEGLQAPQNAPADTQYCGQFYHQPDSAKPVATISIPICLNKV